MTEKDYILLLDEALLNRGIVERQEILDDYRQHFNDGRAAGQSDAETIQQLGSPVEAASEYNVDPRSSPPPIKSGKPRRWILITAFALLFALCLSTLIIALRHPPNIPSMPDARLIRGLSDYINDIMDEALQGLPALDNIDLGNFGTRGWNTAPEAVYKPLDYNQTFNGVDSVAVAGSWNLGCSFECSPDGSLRVELSGMIPEAHDVTVSLESGLLLIKYDDHRAIRLSVNQQALATIYLPENWEGIAEALTLSGSVSANAGVSFGSLTARTVSGSITAAEVSCGALTTDAVSGDVILSDVRTESLKVITVSGDISTSLPIQPRSMTLSSVSGDVAVRMDGSYQFSFSSTSGSLHNESQGREGTGGYSFSTVSGDILLSRYR
ncbi:MAG: DUF4097 family beta strand repeat-containing protein [Oscillospiraceae bacterium]|nr:DUF4097 family beta strand repeat-containing protein [Oscillospiraceae bacterium]